ncbi:MAG TPA: HAMP domain-containing sensor histidine kinase [Gemmatimonadaceae bacterium]|nr:HAMP domain-containing sensor histidine kinase [Gemmatimonadaceae bacterium]
MDEDEERLLQSVALQNANSIFLARQRAEHELVRIKEALEAKSEALAQSLAATEASLKERDRARAEAEAARRVAQEANEAKGRFLSMISHELRTPLGAIGGYAALLVEEIHGPLGAEQRKYIARIQHNQQHLLRLVNELLDLAKIEAGHSPLDLVSVPVQAVLDSVHTMIEPQARASQLRLEVQKQDPALHFCGDAKRVEQIVLNLLSNAVKFTPAGGTVTVTATSMPAEVHLNVQDTGVGIPAAKLEQVFEPFFQVELQPMRTTRGTGLGLAISRELARAMRGDLTVESTPGQGSTFTLCLPRAAAVTPDA